ncbi:MAG TPA: hypothetical protein VF715_02040 [Thermoleophilaceae bacterium]
MARIVEPKHSWERLLPSERAITLAEDFEALLGVSDHAPYLRIRLVDATVEAQDLEELRNDLTDVRERDIRDLTIGVGDEAATIWLETAAPSALHEEGRTQLRVTGNDETKVYGVFERLRRNVERTFEQLDDPEAEVVPESKGGIAIGAISTGHTSSIAIAGESGATSSAVAHQTPALQGSKGSGSSQGGGWSANQWLVAVVGGTIAAVAGGAILYWLF